MGKMFSGGKSKTISLPSSIREKLLESRGKSFVMQKQNAIHDEVERVEKKKKFESFLTYRKRLTRLALMQALYFHEQFKMFNETKYSLEEEVNEIYRVIIFFYRRIFFYQKYGESKKTRKLDERFLRNAITICIKEMKVIDSHIEPAIKEGWKLDSLDSTIRAGLRAGVFEALFEKKTRPKIITSEYTNVVSGCVFEKETNFFNAVLDSIVKKIEAEKQQS